MKYNERALVLPTVNPIIIVTLVIITISPIIESNKPALCFYACIEILQVVKLILKMHALHYTASSSTSRA